MSHELEIGSDGNAMMAYVGEKPWHRLGHELEPGTPPAVFLEKAGLLWRVVKHPCYIDLQEIVDGVEQPKQVVTNRSALVRSSDNKILDVVPSNWQPLQNEEAFDFFVDFTEKGEMEMHTAGSLKGGQLVWGLAKIKDGFFVGKKKNDAVESHLLFTNPHQFGRAIDIRFTPIRVVCWNTLSLALGVRGDLTVDQQIVRVNHRKVFDAEKVKDTLGIARRKLEEYRDAANFIASKRYTDESLFDYFSRLFESNRKDGQASRNHIEALSAINRMPGHDIEPGSWWQAFNAVTYLTDHVLGRAVDTRLESAWFGANRKKKTEALNLAVEMAKNSKDLEIA